MQYTESQLKNVEDKAAEMMSPSEVAILLEIDEQEFLDQMALQGSPARIAYMRGLSRTNNLLRKQLLELANAGSPAAIAECRARMQLLDNIITL